MLSRRGAVWCVWVAACSLAAGRAAADDGLRAVNVERYGVSVRVPQAWRLIAWAEDEKAFVLRLPQEGGSEVGYVACEIGVAPQALEEFQRRHQASHEQEQQRGQPRWRLARNQIAELDEAVYGPELAGAVGRRLDSVWEHHAPDGSTWFEQRTRMISEHTLYTFVLTSDEAHYEAYRLDFEDMLKGVRFSPPETGVARMPNGYWLQREFRFALRLPEEWRPALGPSDKVLFFATGAVHEVFTDNLLVLATPSRPLDLERLRESLPQAVQLEDPQAVVARCEVVAQGRLPALETVIHTRRGELEVTVVERRFAGARRNYEVKFTCQTGEYQRLEAELKQSLDSFVEVSEEKKTVL